jgi:hypothetical protein
VTLSDANELQNTRIKLSELESRYQALSRDLAEDARVRRLTLISLRRLINQLTEEIARVESRSRRA